MATKSLDDILASLKAEIGEIEALPEKTTDLLGEVEDLEQELIDNQAELERETKFSGQIQKDVTAKEEEVAKLRAELELKRQEGAKWEQTFQETAAQKEELVRKIAEVKSRLEVQLAENEELDKKCTELTTENQTLLELLGPSPLDIENLRQELEALEESSLDMDDIKEKYLQQIREYSAAYNSFKAMLNEVGFNLENQEFDEETLQRVINQLKEIQDRLEQQVETKHSAAQAQASKNDQIADIRDILLENERLQSRLNEIQAQAGSESAPQNLEELQAINQELSRKVEEATASLRSAGEEDSQRAQLLQSIRQQEQQLAEIEQKKQALLSKVEELNGLSNSDTFRRNNESLLRELNERQREVAEAASFDHLQETVITTLDLIQSNLAQQGKINDEIHNLHEVKGVSSSNGNPAVANVVRPNATTKQPCLIL